MKLVNADEAVERLEWQHAEVSKEPETVENVLLLSHLQFAVDVLKYLPEWKDGKTDGND